MPASPETPKVPLFFLVATFVGAGIVGALILYFGLGGQLGGGIP